MILRNKKAENSSYFGNESSAAIAMTFVLLRGLTDKMNIVHSMISIGRGVLPGRSPENTVSIRPSIAHTTLPCATALVCDGYL
jgi:hypothetical protein